MKIVDLSKDNYALYLQQITEVHMDAYSKKHLTANFSQEKLEEYYQCLIEASELSLICLDDSSGQNEIGSPLVVGFVIAGSAVSKGVAKFLSLNRLYVLSVLLRKPRFLIEKFFVTIISRVKKSKPSATEFRLMSISVRSSFQSKGVGKIMLDCFEQGLINHGIKSYGLSVRGENVRAVAFYEKNGFKLEKVSHGSKYYFKNLGQ
ncbi:MAG: N-acetyltransferase [bacterium]|nr:N-acetyltransferase [bacterium]